MSGAVAPWICCQLGAREHYAVPLALHRAGRLGLMVTDAWVRPGTMLRRLPARLPRRLAERFHAELADAPVRDMTLALVAQELRWRMRRREGWDQLIERNDWFQKGAVQILEGYRPLEGETPVVFAHAYSARRIFRLAKARGWKTVLGQIDPGEVHFAMVRRLSDESPQYGAPPPGPPIQYFEDWREECALADRIVVNSDWSSQAVARAGIDPDKVHVIPLAFEPERGAPVAVRDYPRAFSAARPLRVLFVGSVSVGKGAAHLLEAVALLRGLPLTVRLVGEPAMVVPDAFRTHPSIEWVGAVSRGEVMRHYRESDVLVFPSCSDGFGMAQVEALACGLPVIASPYCGRVVVDGVSGILLGDVSAHSIATAIRSLLAQPGLLATFSANASSSAPLGITGMGTRLLQVAP